jgi:4a-hydroxytetrahydrobiopterin dehydratase
VSDPKQRLTESDVRAAGLDDWRHVLGALRVRFRTNGFATGLALVDRIGAAADAADHHPDVTLTWPEVAVTLRSHDVGGLTSRDVELARVISGLAAEAGVSADPASVTVVEWGLDTHDPGGLTPFWAAVLGVDADDGDHGVAGDGPWSTDLWYQASEERGTPAPAQRWHPDVWVPHDQGEARVRAAVEAGGRLVDDSEAPSFWVLEDPQGNRACVCTVLDRDSHD